MLTKRTAKTKKEVLHIIDSITEYVRLDGAHNLASKMIYVTDYINNQVQAGVIGNFAGVEDCYNNFWKDILEENGELDWEQVKKELFDYANILREVSIVYDTLTMGRISKPNTKAQVVIDEVNEVNREIEEDDSKISL